jgi:HEAT repeat protein
MVLSKKTNTQSIADRKPAADSDALHTQLGDVDVEARRWAARDGVALRASAILASHLVDEAEPSVRKIIVTSLAQIGDGAAVRGLVNCLRCQDAQLRCDALEALKSLPEAVAPMMRELLTDTDPDVRIQAVNLLEVLSQPQVEAWLIDIIESDPDINVCGAALNLLSETGTSAAAPALRRLRARFVDATYIRFAADLALKRVSSD